jgi:hypothetical protein
MNRVRDTRRMAETENTGSGRKPEWPDPSGERPDTIAMTNIGVSVPEEGNPLQRAWDWEVGPCVDRLGHITSWDINVRAEPGSRGVVVIASVYSGESVARAILAACQATTEHPLARMTRLDEEMGLYDDEHISPDEPVQGHSS